MFYRFVYCRSKLKCANEHYKLLLYSNLQIRKVKGYKIRSLNEKNMAFGPSNYKAEMASGTADLNYHTR